MEVFIKIWLENGDEFGDEFLVHLKNCHFCELRLETYLHCNHFPVIEMWVFIDLDLSHTTTSKHGRVSVLLSQITIGAEILVVVSLYAYEILYTARLHILSVCPN